MLERISHPAPNIEGDVPLGPNNSQRTSPAGSALLVVDRLNVTVVGFLRQDTMNANTQTWRTVA